MVEVQFAFQSHHHGVRTVQSPFRWGVTDDSPGTAFAPTIPFGMGRPLLLVDRLKVMRFTRGVRLYRLCWRPPECEWPSGGRPRPEKTPTLPTASLVPRQLYAAARYSRSVQSPAQLRHPTAHIRPLAIGTIPYCVYQVIGAYCMESALQCLITRPSCMPLEYYVRR